MTEKLAEMRRAALDWLARRDYSRTEIIRKLQRKFGNDVDFSELMSWLEEQRFIDEARYLQMLIRSAIERGHGVLRIRQDTRQRGLPSALIEQSLASLDTDWFAQAKAVRERRFGLRTGLDQKEKARQLRYLQYRGFTAEQCFYALDASSETDL